MTSAILAAACGVRPSGPPAPSGLKLRITHLYCAQAQPCDPAPQVAHEGELIFASRDSVVIFSLRDQREYAVPVGEIARLEVFRGQRGSVEGAAIGLAKGALVGAATGAVFGTSSVVMGAIMDSSDEPEKVIAAGAAGGAVIGAYAGAIEGATKGNDVWQEITIRRLLQDLCRCQEPEGAGADTTALS